MTTHDAAPASPAASAAALFARGLAAHEAGDHAAARAAFLRVLELDPRHVQALNNLGLIALAAHRHDEAVDLIGRAVTLEAGRADLWNNLGVALSAQDRRRAGHAFRLAVERAPAKASFRCNLANCLKECGETRAALEVFREVIALAPDHAEAHHGAALCLLALGRFGEAWREYRWRTRAGGAQIAPEVARLFRQVPALAGEPGALPLAGARILILPEQGLGDQLFFLRFIPVLTRLGARPRVLASARLAPLLRRCRAIAGLVVEEGPVPAADGALFVGDLPWACTAAGASLPPPLAIDADADAVADVRERLARAGPPPYLGLTWRAGLPAGAGRPDSLRKSVPVGQLAAAVSHWPGTVVAVQRHPAAGEIDALARGCGRAVADASGAHEDLVALHALLAALDDYAGVSSTGMHLRAAAGSGGHVLVAFPPEWRWLGEGATSPWYPALALYREQEAAGWQPALSTLAARLGRRAARPP